VYHTLYNIVYAILRFNFAVHKVKHSQPSLPGPFRVGLRASKLHLVANSSHDARIIYRIGRSYAEWRAATSSASWAGPVLTYNKNETAVGKAPARDSDGVPRDELFISA
jgi:hypothetical protein